MEPPAPAFPRGHRMSGPWQIRTGQHGQAFYETSVREPMPALLDELSGESGPGRIARPGPGCTVPGR
jgi:hypothetical protein